MRLVNSITCGMETAATDTDKREDIYDKRSRIELGMHFSDHEDPGGRVAEENHRCFRINQVRQTPRSSVRPGHKNLVSGEQTEK